MHQKSRDDLLDWAPGSGSVWCICQPTISAPPSSFQHHEELPPQLDAVFPQCPNTIYREENCLPSMYCTQPRIELVFLRHGIPWNVMWISAAPFVPGCRTLHLVGFIHTHVHKWTELNKKSNLLCCVWMPGPQQYLLMWRFLHLLFYHKHTYQTASGSNPISAYLH